MLVFVVVLAGAIGACLGLVVDGGRMLIDATRAATLAHEAARAGARELDATALAQEGRIGVDADAARRRALEHLRAAGADGEAVVEGDAVTVTARVPYTTVILPLGSGAAQARATAEAIEN
ncbi:pilus assembly protein TadG-related protein [Nocardiopsis composta]